MSGPAEKISHIFQWKMLFGIIIRKRNKIQKKKKTSKKQDKKKLDQKI